MRESGWGNLVANLFMRGVKDFSRVVFPSSFPVFSNTFSPARSAPVYPSTYRFLPNFHTTNNNKVYILISINYQVGG